MAGALVGMVSGETRKRRGNWQRLGEAAYSSGRLDRHRVTGMAVTAAGNGVMAGERKGSTCLNALAYCGSASFVTENSRCGGVAQKLPAAAMPRRPALARQPGPAAMASWRQ